MLPFEWEEVMDGIRNELKDLETRYWGAVQRKDADRAMSLSDSSCIVVGAQGVGTLDRARLGDMLKQASYELTRFEIDDSTFEVCKLTDDVALVAYRVREDLVVDGTPESVEAFDASVWVRRGDSWFCALHTESLKGDPFGRTEINRLVESEAG
jgi:hypothetical protein